jgi:N-acetylneuraminic acid mutarotase
MYVFGGHNNGATTYYDDLYVYDSSANSWTLLAPSGAPPVARYQHGAAAITGKMYIFGGMKKTTPQELNDLWA